MSSERAAKPKVYKRDGYWYIETPGRDEQCVSWEQGMERVRMWHQYNDAAALRNQWYGDWYASHYGKQWRGSW